MSFWNDLTNFFTTFSQASFDELIADIQQDIEVAESDLAKAAAWIVANGPNYVQDAQTLVAVLAALTGNLTIPASVISTLNVAIADMQQFIGAVTTVSSGTTSAFDALAAYGGSETPAVISSGYKVHQALVEATAAARGTLAAATKKKA
jgi:hypothetical protein